MEQSFTANYQHNIITTPESVVWIDYSTKLYIFFEYFSVMFFSVLILVTIIAFCLALIPNLKIGRGFWSGFPVEIYLVGSFWGLLFVGSFYGEIVFKFLTNGSKIFQRIFFVSSGTGEFLSFVTIVVLIFLAIFGMFQTGASIGAGIRDGWKQYLKKQSIIVKMTLSIFGFIKKQCIRLSKVDLNKSLERNLLKYICINAVLMALLCMTWFFGVFGVVIYSAVLFYLLRKKLLQLEQGHNTLLKAADRMANGKLNQPIEEDLGILNQLKDKMNDVQQGFANAVEQEVRSRNMKTELITNVSHDLKTPLTAIITYVDLLKNPDLEPETRQEYIDTLDRKSQRLKRLIEDLFEVSKAATGNVVMNCENLDLAALLRQVQYEMEDSTNSSGIDYRWNLGEEKVLVNLDGQRSCRVFENLVSNINKYGLKGTRAYISLEIKQHLAVVSFKNISAQEIEGDILRLTERFVRGDSSRSTEGSGLGLAIAKSFTELQNGTFVIETDGDLFKVWVSFPMIESE